MNVSIHGNAILITSTVTVKQIETLRKLKPDALTLFEEIGDVKVPVFLVSTTKGEAALDNTGILFDGQNSEGFAQATMMFRCEAADPKEAIADVYGAGLTKLKAWEETVPAVVEAVEAERAALLACIDG